MFFDLGRIEGLPTQYAEIRHPVTVDVLEAGLITAYLVLLLALLVSQAARTDRLQAILNCTRIFVMLTIGLFILLSNYGQEWEVATIKTRTPYKAGVSQEINATVGIKIGLRSVNVTLRSDDAKTGRLKDETIDYNERFHWSEPWDQGRFGFGPFAGTVQREFRAAQYRGAPVPILWIVDYFVIDGEGFRHGRFYRTAGWYAHLLVWTSFVCWLIANVLFRSVIEYGAYALAATGTMQLGAVVVWSCVRNANPLTVPFEDDVLAPRYGFSYWLTMVTGIVCLLLAIAVLILDRFPAVPLHRVFDVDPLDLYEVAYITDEEKQLLRRKASRSQRRNQDRSAEDTLEMIDVTGNQSRQRYGQKEEQQEAYGTRPEHTGQVLIRRSMLMNNDLKNVLRTTRKDSVIYENVMKI